MMDKIEWYREVLELEPSSKLFFPLARLLVEDGQPEAALETCAGGWSVIPNFLKHGFFISSSSIITGSPKPAWRR